MDELTRNCESAPEVIWIERDGTKTPVLRGLAAPYYDGTPATEYNVMGNLFERYAQGCFREVLSQSPDVFCRADHLATKTMGRTPRLRLWEDARGLNFENPLSKSTTSQDVLADYDAGIYKGCSVRMTNDLRNPANATWHREGNKEIVTIKRVLRLRDVGPVQEPAYLGTELSVYRSARDAWLLDEETKKRLTMLNNIRETARVQR